MGLRGNKNDAFKEKDYFATEKFEEYLKDPFNRRYANSDQFARALGEDFVENYLSQNYMKTRRLIIQAWPELTSLAGEPAMTAIPSFIVSGIATVITGIAVTIWSATRIQSKNGGLMLILLSMMILLVGGGLLPPVSGVVAGIIGARVRQKDLKTSHQKI